MVISGESLDPMVVLDGPLPQDFLGNSAGAMNAAEEVHDVLWTGQERQVAKDDDAVETVVCKCQQFTEQFGEFFHRSSSSLVLESPTRALGQRTDGDQIRRRPHHDGLEHPTGFSRPLSGERRGNFKYFCLVLVQQPKLLVAGIAAAPKDRHHRVTTAGELGNPAYVLGATPARYQRDSGETPFGAQASARRDFRLRNIARDGSRLQALLHA
jgi:hypothetical protein